MGWLVGLCALSVSACGSTIDVGNGSSTGTGTGTGDSAACDEYASYCKIPAAGAEKLDACRKATADAKCGSKATEAYRCLMTSRATCNSAYELEDVAVCTGEQNAYRACAYPECDDDADCAGTGRNFCLLGSNTCVECLTDAHCGASGRLCTDHACPGLKESLPPTEAQFPEP